MLSPFSSHLGFVGLVHLTFVQNLPAAVIDLFTDGPQSVEILTSNGAERGAAPVVLTHGLFDYRDLSIQYGAQRASIQEGRLQYTVSPTPTVAKGNNEGYLDLRYSSSSPVDLLGEGATAFQIKFDYVGAAPQFLFRFYIGNPDSPYPSQADLKNYITASSFSGEITIPFSHFSVEDLSRVQFLGIDAARVPMGTSFTISSITTVPEPTFPALASGLALGLLFRRSRPSLRLC